MDEINTVLGQVPPAIRDHGTPRQKLEAVWRTMAIHRNGVQTRVAADVAEAWLGTGQAPRLPVDDPRTAAKRIEKALNGEAALSLDFAHVLIGCFPPAYRAAAKVLVFPGSAIEEDPADLRAALIVDAQHDSETDRLRFDLVLNGDEQRSPEMLEAKALKFEQAGKSQLNVAKQLRIKAAAARRRVDNIQRQSAH